MKRETQGVGWSQNYSHLHFVLSAIWNCGAASVERRITKLWFITGLVDGQISTEGEATHLAKSWLEGLLNKLVTKRQKGARATAMTTAERTCISHKEKEKFCTLCTFRSCSRPINDVEWAVLQLCGRPVFTWWRKFLISSFCHHTAHHDTNFIPR